MHCVISELLSIFGSDQSPGHIAVMILAIYGTVAYFIYSIVQKRLQLAVVEKEETQRRTSVLHSPSQGEKNLSGEIKRNEAKQNTQDANVPRPLQPLPLQPLLPAIAKAPSVSVQSFCTLIIASALVRRRARTFGLHVKKKGSTQVKKEWSSLKYSTIVVSTGSSWASEACRINTKKKAAISNPTTAPWFVDLHYQIKSGQQTIL